jgi:hypothetical protein
MSDFNRRNTVPLELRQLMHRSFDDSLGESDFEELQSALKSNPEARLLYGELAQLHADLTSQKQADAICKEVQHEFQGAATDAARETLEFGRPDSRRQKLLDLVRTFPLRLAASLLILGLGLGCGVGIMAASLHFLPMPPTFLPLPWNWQVNSDVVAKVEATHDVVWQTASENPDTPPTRGLRVGQQVRISQGLMQLTYRNGVGVVLQGPAIFEVRSEHGGKLFSGKLSVTMPAGVKPFHIEILAGRLQVGVGHVGIDAGESALDRQVVVNALSGVAPGIAMAQFVSNSGVTVDLMPGDAFRFSDSGVESRVELAAASDFPVTLPQPKQQAFAGSTILLGNLFDDNMTASLTEAMRTDEYQAAAETVDLGVAAVHDGGLDVDTSLAEDGVWFNFLNVGGGGAKVAGLPGNDTYRSNLPIAIRTTGEDLQHDLADGRMSKIEEGVGISANELLTFDLKELRKAGKIEGRSMRFVADRAGLNDREAPLLDSRQNAHANLVVIVSTEDQVLSAYMNGEAIGVVEHANVYSIDVDDERATRGLGYDGNFVEFNVPIPVEARFLTLVATQLEKEHHDHTVFSGARLELEPHQDGQEVRKE